MQRFLFLLCTLSSSKCNSMDLWRSCSSSCKRYFCQIGKGFDHQFNSMEGREAKRHALSRYAQNSTYYNRWHSVFRHEFISLIWLRERDVICQAARLAMRHISPNEYRVVITAIVVSCLLEGSVNTVTSSNKVTVTRFKISKSFDWLSIILKRKKILFNAGEDVSIRPASSDKTTHYAASKRTD